MYEYNIYTYIYIYIKIYIIYIYIYYIYICIYIYLYIYIYIYIYKKNFLTPLNLTCTKVKTHLYPVITQLIRNCSRKPSTPQLQQFQDRPLPGITSPYAET